MLIIMKNNTRDSTRFVFIGYFTAVGAAVLSGLMPSVSKPILTNMNPLFFTAIVTLSPALWFTPISIRSSENKSMRKGGYLILGGTAIAGNLVAPYFYFLGVSETTASSAALLANGEMLFTVLIATMFFGERLSSKGALALTILAVGIITVVTNLQFSTSLEALIKPGSLLILLATALWGLDNNVTSVITDRVNVARIIQLKALIAGAGLLLIAFLSRAIIITSTQGLIQVIVFGLIIFSGGVFLSIETLKRLGAIRTTIVFPINSMFGLLFAFILLGENITLLQIGSVALMMFGIYLLTRRGSVLKEGILLEQI
jgi:drug/metabolite transporter (DMT)-like permease